MNTMELGAIGELMGGVAVIASLIYVGMQVRQRNRIATNSAAQRFREINNEVLRQLFSDPNLTKVESYGRNFERMMRQPGALTSWRDQKHQLTARFQNYLDQNFFPPSAQEA